MTGWNSNKEQSIINEVNISDDYIFAATEDNNTKKIFTDDEFSKILRAKNKNSFYKHYVYIYMFII